MSENERQKLKIIFFENFKIRAERNGVKYAFPDDKEPKFIYPGDEIPKEITPDNMPSWCMLNRRERKLKK